MKEDELEGIDEHNKFMADLYAVSQGKQRTGIFCKDCREQRKKMVEMFALNPDQQNASFPPSLTITCPECNRTDYKTVRPKKNLTLNTKANLSINVALSTTKKIYRFLVKKCLNMELSMRISRLQMKKY